MDSIQRGKSKRGKREKEILHDLKEARSLTVKELEKRHPRSSIYDVGKRLIKRGKARWIRVERNGREQRALKYVETTASPEEIGLLKKYLLSSNPVVKREAVEDFVSLAFKYEGIPLDGVDFLIKNWYLQDNVKVRERLLVALCTLAIKAKTKGSSDVIKKVGSAADDFLRVVKDSNESVESRKSAWRLLILLEEPRITEIAFKLLKNEEEHKEVINYVREEVKRYAEENPIDAKKKLYNILIEDVGKSEIQERVLSLLQTIRTTDTRES